MRLLFLSLLVLLLVGCASQPSYREATDLERHQARSILIVPVLNNSLDIMASDAVLASLPRLLGELGYYVFPVHTVRTLLEQDGYYEAARIHDLPPHELASLFGADLVLYVRIEQWAAQYIVLQTSTVVELDYRLSNGQGQTLWQERQLLRHTTEGPGVNNGLVGLLGSAINAAMERAAPNFLPLMQQANQQALVQGSSRLPPGPYHPGFARYYQYVRLQDAQLQDMPATNDQDEPALAR